MPDLPSSPIRLRGLGYERYMSEMGGRMKRAGGVGVTEGHIQCIYHDKASIFIYLELYAPPSK